MLSIWTNFDPVFAFSLCLSYSERCAGVTVVLHVLKSLHMLLSYVENRKGISKNLSLVIFAELENHIYKDNTEFWQIQCNINYECFLEFVSDVCSNYITYKMNFSIKDFFNKCDQVWVKLRVWSYLLRNP